MDLTSLQSIEQQLIEEPVRSMIEKNEYMQNLKSECYFKENALKTAENLIEEYHRENEELKTEIFRLNQKIENYEERMEILLQQVELKNTSNAKTYQKQLFKSSFKLSKVLEKYSELQEKYYALQKELAKYKFYKQENEQRIMKENDKKQKELKIEIQRQFDNFLRTPVNKSQFNTNPSTSKKTSAPKYKNLKQIKLTDFESESINDREKTKNYYDSSSDETKGNRRTGESRFENRPSIKQSASKIQKIHQKQLKEKRKQTQEDGILNKKLKILEWKLKEKDQEIMLMLRRNKEIEGKYSLLKEILQNQKESLSFGENNERKSAKNKEYK